MIAQSSSLTSAGRRSTEERDIANSRHCRDTGKEPRCAGRILRCCAGARRSAMGEAFDVVTEVLMQDRQLCAFNRWRAPCRMVIPCYIAQRILTPPRFGCTGQSSGALAITGRRPGFFVRYAGATRRLRNLILHKRGDIAFSMGPPL